MLSHLFFITFSRLSLAPLQPLQNLGPGSGLPSVFLSKRQAVQVLPAMRIRKALEIDVDSIESRIAQLFNKQSPYERQKSRLIDQLWQFLASLPMPKDQMSASPHDLVRFLVWKDKSGKTQVNAVGCPRRGLTCPFQCGCPYRLAAGSVDSLIGKLRAIFKENDRAGYWDERLGLGNPAASLLVRKYLKCIKEEQATAGLTPKQATPLFVDKLARLSDHLDRQLETCKTDPIKITCSLRRSFATIIPVLS